VPAIAAELHVSVSTLHRAFADQQCTIAEWIWAQRLDGVHADLVDPTCAHRTIGDIAFSWGFRGRLALQPGVPRPVRGYGAGGAGGSTTNWRSDRST
jgi:AraC-like DNA-binding protein